LITSKELTVAPRPARPDLRDLKARAIVEAAALVFSERGLRSARMADVAERAGIGKGTVYEYFRSKEDLFLAVFDAFGVGMLDDLLAQLEPHPSSASAYLRRFCDAMLEALQQVLYIYPLTMEFWSAAATSELKDRLMGEFRKTYASYRRVLASVIRQGKSAGEFATHVDPDHMAAALVGAFDALFLQAWLDPDFDAMAVGNHLLDVTLRGMAAEPRDSAAPEN
jgi:AcrR family transcriptional regulator